jgi:hypothetical protein
MSPWKRVRHIAAFGLIAAGFAVGALPGEWIEKWLGWSPDDGAGFTEAAIVGCLLTLGSFLAGDLFYDAIARWRATPAAKLLAGRRSTRQDR